VSTHAVSMSLVPTPEELAIREAVCGICERFGPRYARDCYEKEQPPQELWEALGQAGFVGIDIPVEWGGGGLGMNGLQVVGEEVGAATGMGMLMLVVSSGSAGSVLAIHGTEAQKEKWLRGVAAGTTRLSFAITEPDAGTNTHNLRTELRADGDRYLLRGQKVFISGVENAHAILGG